MIFRIQLQGKLRDSFSSSLHDMLKGLPGTRSGSFDGESWKGNEEEKYKPHGLPLAVKGVTFQ